MSACFDALLQARGEEFVSAKIKISRVIAK